MPTQWAKLLVPAFLIGQTWLVHVSSASERPPAPPDLEHFPSAINGWTEMRDVPVDPDVMNTLAADRLLNRSYQSQSAGLPVELLVAWFQSQRAGASQPHSPKVCLPAAGWRTLSAADMTVSTAAGPLTLNRYVVGNRRERAVVLYWYQNSRRAVADEWASKFWIVAGALRDHRTDTALVRLVVETDPDAGPEKIDQASAIASGFASGVYPLLRDALPH
jgi:EpsI family protein